MRVVDVNGREVGYLDTIIFHELLDKSEGSVATIVPQAERYKPQMGYFIGTSDDSSSSPNLVYATDLVRGQPKNEKTVCIDNVRSLKITVKRQHL